MMIRTTPMFALLTLMLSPALAQSDQVPPALFHPKLSIETDILWPIFPGVFRGHLLFNLWQRGQLRGDVYVGVNYDFPQDRTTEGRFSDYSLVTGYRQYLYRGFHMEVNQQIGYGSLQNHVTTDKEYRSLDWGVQLLGGYKYDIPNTRWYTAVQLGVGGTVYQSNPWPIYTDDTLNEEVGNEIIFIGGIQLGIHF